MSNNDKQLTPSNKRSSNFFSTVKSVIGAMFGVQSDSQLEKDFQKTDPLALVLGGIVFVVVFIIGVMWIVDLAMANAGK